MTEQTATTRGGMRVAITSAASSDELELYEAFCALVAADDGYPQSPEESVSLQSFRHYWLGSATAAFVARREHDGALVGAYTMKPNGIGRASHVANAGYFVVPSERGRGLGELLVVHSLEQARALGFDAMQFNFVFESNPARRLYERLGFEVVGRVPDVIDGEAVMLYWRRL